MTLGSLFDGIGGFPLAASRHGIRTLWASDIEPTCETVTKHHFPHALQLGDITQIHGGKISPVHVLTGGSPCQDLSVAGKRAGLEGERSGLFMDMIRIIKEMRNATNNLYPRYVIWENVPGAFSSNKGADFQAVIEEFCRCADPIVSIPRPAKWSNAGAVMGNGFSIAWRTLDAQYWGVPQRRRRIFLVADFGGNTAPEILFKRESVSGDIEPRGAEGEGLATDAEGRVDGSGGDGGINAASFMAGQGAKAKGIGWQEEITPTLKSTNSGTNTVPSIVISKDREGKAGGGKGLLTSTDKAFTLCARQDQRICYTKTAHPMNSQQGQGYEQTDTAKTLNGFNTSESRAEEVIVQSVDCRNLKLTEKHGTLQAKENGGQSLNYMGAVAYTCGNGQANDATTLQPETARTLNTMHDQQIVMQPRQRKYILRRLTPTEAERLQWFPDGWTDIPHNGKPMSDSARYRMLGNSVAVLCVEFIMKNIKKELGGIPYETKDDQAYRKRRHP